MVECPACGAPTDDDARFCPACGARLLAAAEPPAREQRKTVTAVFTDLVESTALASRLDPEALRALMTRYYDAMRGEVERHGGRVDKFIGDAVVAFFGVPVAHEDDALRAVRAAAGMRAALAALNDELDESFGVRVQIRTGVNTGDVLAGEVAAPETFTVGDAVNIAARLEQGAAPGEVLLGETTHRLVRHAVRAEPLDPLTVKGKDDPVPAYRLVTIAEDAPSIPRRLDSPLVGRDHELCLATETFERAQRERGCHLFTILGAAGAGKSRLAAEVIAACESDATVWHGRCLSYGEGITFWPLVEIVRGAAGIVAGDHGNDVVAKLAKLAEGDDDAALIAERLAPITGALPGVVAADEIFWAARKLFEAAARRRALLVVIDDIHWAEPTLLELVDHVVDWSRDAPIMVLCIARPELLDRSPGWAGGKRNATTIHLEPLSDAESAELISNLLEGSPLPPELSGRILAAAEGIPLFVEEMLAILIDSGRLGRSDGEWHAVGDLLGIEVPPTIRALLAARLDALPNDERRLVDVAAIVGREFGRGAVAALAPDDLRPRVGDLLTELRRKDIVLADRSTMRGDDGFRFRHILIRDAAYDSIPRAGRAAMHETFAAWLGEAFEGRTTEVEEIIGYHLQEAFHNRVALRPPDAATRVLADRAAGHLLAAGRRSLDRNDVHAALNLLERAHTLCARPDAELLLAYGSALAHGGSLRRALELFAAAIDEARAAGDERLTWHARIEEMRWRTHVNTEAGVAAEILDVVPGAIPQLERAGDDMGVARAWLSIANAHSVLGQHDLALAAGERALEHAERAGRESMVLDAYRLIGVGAIWGPMPLSEAERRYGDLLDRVGDGPLRKIAATELVASLRMQRGDVAEGRALIAQVKELYDELGDRLLAAKVAMIEHRGPLGEQDFETVEAILADACEILEAAGERSWFSTSIAVLAAALYGLGRLDEAYEATMKSEQSGSADDVVTQAYWRAERAKVLARWSRGDEALALGHEAERLITATDGLLEQADVYGALGEVYRVLGRDNEARAALGEAVRRYEAKGATSFAHSAHARLAAIGG
jgi:class 3 adenylate cyclase/tetratricopeptide (TPR) repeat protein